MKIQKSIEDKIQSQLKPELVEIENESHKHSALLGSESHFKVLVVAESFADKNRVARQRWIHELLADELRQGVHALSLRLLTPMEYVAQNPDSFKSPNCKGNH